MINPPNRFFLKAGIWLSVFGAFTSAAAGPFFNQNGNAEHIISARSALEKNDLGTAEREIKNALSNNEDPPVAHWVLARIQLERKQYDRALKNLDQAIKLKPDFAAAHYLHAYILFRTDLLVDYTSPGSTPLYKIHRLLDVRNEANLAIQQGDHSANAYLLAAELELAYSKYRGYSLAKGAETPVEARKNMKLVDSAALHLYDEAFKSIPRDFNRYDEFKEKSEFLRHFLAQTLEDDAKYQRSKPRNLPLPELTQEAQAHRVRGVVTVGIHLNDRGEMDQMLVLSGLGFGLDAKALDAVKRMEFDPATLDGKPASTYAVVTVSFLVL